MTRYPVKDEMKRQLDNIFTYHAPFGDQPQRYVAIRDKAKELAILIVETTCPSREQSLAITQIQLAVMFANSSIAMHEPNDFSITTEEIEEIQEEIRESEKLTKDDIGELDTAKLFGNQSDK